MPDDLTKSSDSIRDFLTHLNYVECLNVLSDGIKLECKRRIRAKNVSRRKLSKKTNLIKLTKKSLNAEYTIIRNNPEFAEVCVPWVAVKAYYLLLNMFLILEYLITNDESAFNIGHATLFKTLKKYLGDETLVFSNNLINKVYNVSEVLNFKFPAGYNIKTTNVNIETRFHQMLKKLVDYRLDDMLRRYRFKDWRKKKAKKIKAQYIGHSDVNACEFFYWYRIKSNYRDLEFLDKDISGEQFKSFYANYYLLTMNFYKALKNTINNLSRVRLSEEIIN